MYFQQATPLSLTIEDYDHLVHCYMAFRALVWLSDRNIYSKPLLRGARKGTFMMFTCSIQNIFPCHLLVDLFYNNALHMEIT